MVLIPQRGAERLSSNSQALCNAAKLGELRNAQSKLYRNSVGSLLWPFFLHYRCTSWPLFLNLMVNTCAFKIQAICGPDTGFGEIKIGTLQDLNLHLRLFHSQIFPFGDSKLAGIRVKHDIWTFCWRSTARMTSFKKSHIPVSESKYDTWTFCWRWTARMTSFKNHGRNRFSYALPTLYAVHESPRPHLRVKMNRELE
ncbi:hypothetical protein C8J57DRAFT_1480914 [Mycena rebaudengoi]|nr:hypothetical protein C8J57DRAFT_1480914 [Mycena rebaudengoi]